MLGYTILGGMWSVALTDLFQSVVILIGLTAVAVLVGDMAGGAAKVISAAAEAGKFEFWPKGGTKEWLAFAAAWMTLAIGSIPQQDVFQRVTSAKDERTAVMGSLIGGAAYFCFAFVPMFIAYAALVIDPASRSCSPARTRARSSASCPDLILERTPMWAQVLFFGALLSAILSTASGALLAPTALFTENVIRPFAPRMGDRQFLLLLRTVLVVHARRAALRAQLEEHDVRDGAERLQGDAGVVHRAPRRRHLLEAREQRGGRALGRLRARFLDHRGRLTAPEATVRRSSSASPSRSSAWCSARSFRVR